MDISNASDLRRILIVDDNCAIHKDFDKILCSSDDDSDLDRLQTQLFGEERLTAATIRFRINHAFQGREALEMAIEAKRAGTPFDMAFVDMRMPPGWDGVETIEQLWRADPDLQVVICTAYSDYSWPEVLDRFGQGDKLLVLKKPFDNIEALQLASTLTEKRHLARRASLRFEELQHLVAIRTSELEQSRHESERVLAAISSVLVSVDNAGKVVRWNRRAESSFGIRSEQALGRTLDQIPIDWVNAESRERFLQSSLGAGASRDEIEFIDNAGMCRVMGISAYPITEGQRVMGHLILGADLSEQRQLEVQLRQAQKLEAVGQLAAGIAHEINTPIQYIGDNTRFLQDSFAELMKLTDSFDQHLSAADDSVSVAERVARFRKQIVEADLEYLRDEIPQAIQQSLDGIGRVANIVRAMKEFSHPGSDEKTNIDLNHSLQSTLTVATHEWKYVADVQLDLDPNLPAVPCFPGELNQVVLNILVNAAHAIADVVGDGSSGKGCIGLQTRRDDSCAELRISDSGPGIPAEIQSRVFDPFFTTKEVGRGTGQGLALAWSIVAEKHKGSIWFETEAGVGTTFIIRLPLEECGQVEELSNETADSVC